MTLDTDRTTARARQLWADALGIEAVLPEERTHETSAIGASNARPVRAGMT